MTARPLLLSSLLSLAALPTLAANQTVGGLPSRGAVAGTDQVPMLPSGASTLQAAYASDLKKYALTSIDTFGADPTGATDSTAAIQAAINSGQSLTCNGVYQTSATLNFTTTAAHGQSLVGAGPSDAAGVTTSGRCTFRPSASVTATFRIDGAPFSGYVEGVGLENLTVDMSNMADISTNAAIVQVQAYDCHYSSVRVTHDGSNKRAWLFETGAYTTTLKDTQGNILDFEGTSTSSGVTTINVINHDGAQVVANYADNLNFLGGAFQCVGCVHFTLHYTAATRIQTDIEGTGTYLVVDSTDNGLWSQSELQGFSGTYISGTAAPAQMLLDQQSNFNNYPYNLDFGHFNMNSQGVSGYSSLLSGATNANYYLYIGRTGIDEFLGVAAAANDWVSGTTAGDAVVASWGGGSTLWLAGAQIPNAKVTAAGFYTFGAGTLSQGIVNVRPGSDTDALSVQNHAGAYVFDFNTNTTAANSLFEALNGACLIGYSGNFTGQTWKLCGNNGVGILQQIVGQPGADGVVLQVNNAAVTKNVFSVSSANGGGISLNATEVMASSAPIYSSGFSAGAPTIVGNTTAAFTLALGATPAPSGALLMPAAATGWNCLGADRTTAAGTIRETSTTATSVAFALAGGVAGDVLQFQCAGY